MGGITRSGVLYSTQGGQRAISQLYTSRSSSVALCFFPFFLLLNRLLAYSLARSLSDSVFSDSQHSTLTI